MIRIECLSALHLVEDAQAAARELMPMVKEDADRVFVERVLAADRPPISREQLAAHWQTQGIHAQRADRLEEAIEMHSRAVYITPNDSVRKGGLALCLVIRGCKTSDPSLEADGLRLFEQALSIRRDPTTLFNYAQALRMVWRRAEALSVVQEVLRSSPDDPLAQALLKELREPAVH
jgi:Flp pilus assembly protein TadD